MIPWTWVRVGELGGTDCEALRSGLLAQPANTASSLAYVAAGAWVAWRVRSLAGAARAWAWSYAAVLALVGLGSVDFHGPQTPGAKQLHDWPIAVLIGIGVAIAVRNWRSDGWPFPGSSRRLWVALGGTALAAPVAFALGRTASAACQPGSYLQMHGLWHILTAVGFALIAAMLLPKSVLSKPLVGSPSRGFEAQESRLRRTGGAPREGDAGIGRPATGE